MRHLFIFLLVFSISFCSLAQTFVQLHDAKSKSEIIANDGSRIEFTTSIKELAISNFKFKGEMYSRITAPDLFPDNIVGNPELPAFTKLIEVPYNAEYEINIISYEEQEIELNQYGFEAPLYPNQPPSRKDVDPETIPLMKNSNIYANKEFYSSELVKVENISKMRGVQIAQIIVSPFSYDIETNILTIKNNLRIEIIFKNSNIAQSEKIKISKYSPAFEQSYEKLWNHKSLQTKDPVSKYPIKYVIVSDRMFEEALQPFIEWKTKKGFNVIVAYTDEIGNTNTVIKNYLQGLYDAGTEDNPAPTYLLIVGDVAQVPSFSKNSTYGTHVTDLYYCTFDGNNDYVPDMYFGRFSATNVSQLNAQINKTLMYEQYTFPDPSYLENTMFVVGYDNYWSPTNGNGQVNYAIDYYFNEAHNQNVTAFTHPQARTKLNDIIEIINNGVGYVNYTAHCDESGWDSPNLTTSEVKKLTNTNEFFFSVGNCCLSNNFKVSECFGEALLRAENTGAVIHLGGSNSTTWNEDFYWSVGVTSNITANPTYDETSHGAYDNLFHENDETPYITAGQINYAGNISVMSSTSSLKQYYWEIYHVMGDPSIMPYIGIPTELEVEVDNFIVMGIGNLTVKTEPDAYVALSHEGKLLCAAIADDSGEVNLEFEAILLPGELDIVVTKQFKQPYIEKIQIMAQNNDNDVAIKSIEVPDALLHVSASSFKPSVDILNLGKLNLKSAIVGYDINGENKDEINWVGNLESLASSTVEFDEISLGDGEYEMQFYVKNPNGSDYENLATNNRTRKFKIYSGNVSISEIISPNGVICNETKIIPEITITNKDAYPLNSLMCSFECKDLNYEFMWEGTIEAGQSQNITFPEQNRIESGNEIISFSISNPNGGTNISKSTTNLDKDFYLVRTGQTVEMKLKTDGYPEETSWELVDNSNTSKILYSGNSYSGKNTIYTYEWCLGPGCYTFTIYDSQNDGLYSYFGTSGEVSITNNSINQAILNLAGNGFTSEYSKSFCIDLIECPLDKRFFISDENIKLTGGLPQGGSYSGAGVETGIFNPSEMEAGVYTVKYEYNFENGNSLDCDFFVYVSDFYEITCPKDVKIDIKDGKLLLPELVTPKDGIFSGKGVENDHFDPLVAGKGEHKIKYNHVNLLEEQFECEFKIIVTNTTNINTSEMDAKFQIYPNPVNNILTIKASDSIENIDIEVINIIGQTLKKIHSSKTETKIDMSSYPDGAYFVKITGVDFNTTKKVILRK